MIIVFLFRGELQKPCPGQPTISEVLDFVLKECRKESLVYKMAALRCAGDVLQSTQEDCFSIMAEILLPLIKKVYLAVFLYLYKIMYQLFDLDAELHREPQHIQRVHRK